MNKWHTFQNAARSGEIAFNWGAVRLIVHEGSDIRCTFAHYYETSDTITVPMSFEKVAELLGGEGSPWRCVTTKAGNAFINLQHVRKIEDQPTGHARIYWLGRGDELEALRVSVGQILGPTI